MSAEKYWGQWASQNKINPGYDWGPYDCQQHELKIKFAEAYAIHERERTFDISVDKASAIYDEAIKPHLSDYRLNNKAASMIFGQALLNHLKQNR